MDTYWWDTFAMDTYWWDTFGMDTFGMDVKMTASQRSKQESPPDSQPAADVLPRGQRSFERQMVANHQANAVPLQYESP